MIRTEIKKARRLFTVYGKDIRLQREIAGSLTKYRRALSVTQERMFRAGVIRACTICAAGTGGSCCFQGAEEWYDEVLLLINLLFGVELPERREIPEGCLFVGEKGCRLLARHAFCVNYLCPVLIRSLERQEKGELATVSGEEILAGWELEKKLRPWLKKVQETGQ